MVSLSSIPKESNVYRFITSGKPGNCKFCGKFVDKLESHHICYSPEIVIKLCHYCHHKVHFWIQRLSEMELLKMLRLRYHHQTANKIYKTYKNNPSKLRQLVAPSRKVFLEERENPILVKRKKEVIKKHIVNHTNIYKPKPLSVKMRSKNKFRKSIG